MPNQICKTFSEITLNTLLAIEKCQEIKVKGENSEFKQWRNNGLQKLSPMITSLSNGRGSWVWVMD